MRKARSKNGFSFVEVMAAVAILAIALTVLMNSQARSMDLVGRARSIDYATTLAISKMTELTQTVKEKGIVALRDEESGEFNQENHPGYRWRYWKNEVPMPDFATLLGSVSGGEEGAKNAASNQDLFAGPLKAIGKVWGQALRELHVEVTWGEGRNQRSYELVTHLIASDAITQLQSAIGALTAGLPK